MKKRILIFALLISVSVAYAQEEEQKTEKLQFTLQQAKDFALENNFDVKNAVVDVEIAKKQVWETTAIGLPQVSASASYQFIPGDIPVLDFGFGDESGGSGTEIPQGVTPEFAGMFGMMMAETMGGMGEPRPIAEKHSGTVDLTVNQLVFNGEYIVGLQASKTFKMLSNQAVEIKKNEVAELVSGTYQLILILEENLKILQSSYDNMVKIADEMEEMHKVGFIEATDADQIKLTKSNLENSLKSVKRQIEISHRLLKFQMGVDENTELELTQTLDELINEANLLSITSENFDPANNLNIQLMETQVKISELSFKREKATVLPSLSAFYRHEEKLNAPDFNFSIPDMIGLSLNVPIFASGSRNSKIQQAKLELEKTRNSKELAVQGIILEYNEAVSGYRNALDNYYNQKENLGLSEKIYNNNLAKYKEGTVSSIDLTQAHNQFLTTQSNYFNAVMELFSAKNKIESILNNI